MPWIRDRATRADAEDHYRTLRADAMIVGELSQAPRTIGVTYRAAFALYITASDGVITGTAEDHSANRDDDGRSGQPVEAHGPEQLSVMVSARFGRSEADQLSAPPRLPA